MSELSFEQMLEESLKTIRTGEIVTGKVIDVKEDEIVLNIGYKSDGIIPRSEYTNEANVDLRTQVQVGDEMEAKVVKVNINFDEELMEKYEVMASPTLVFFKDGEETDRTRGLVKKAEIEEKLGALL